MRRELPTGTVTFLFTDIEGSTRLLERLGDAYQPALEEHHRLLRDVFNRHGGVEVDTQGDAFFVAFPSAVEAVRAAAEAQRELVDTELAVRVGLHSGEAAVGETGYVGADVHRAARITAAGHGGQVLLSQATRELVEQDLPEELGLRDLGEHRLKDLTRPQRLHQLLISGLPSQFPALRTIEQRPTNLPVQPAPLIGRERELREARALLGRTRLLTLTGPAGTGKTRLAIQLAADVLEEFDDGAFFVGLADVTDPALVAPRVAQTLGLNERGGVELGDAVADYLAGKRLLLVLDNVEQILGAAPDVSRWISVAGESKVLATGRTALRLSVEQEYPVPPLPGAAAIELFAERARAVRPDFALDGDRTTVAEICTRLDSLPLAIELAAARVNLLPPPKLLERLDQRLSVLTGGARDAPERHQTLRAAIDWSFGLLEVEEQELLVRLSVFAGGFTLEGAEAVCDASIDGLASLVEKSLLTQREGGGDPRFALLETVREYAREWLEERGEAGAVSKRHADYFLSLAEEVGAGGPDEDPEQGRELFAEFDNLRRALSWFRAVADVEGELCLATASLWGLWTRGSLRELGGWLDSALERAAGVEPRLRAAALGASALAAANLGDAEGARASARESLALARELGDKRKIEWALRVLSFDEPDLDERRRLLEECERLLRELGDESGLGWVTYLRGMALLEERRFDQALRTLEAAAALFSRLGRRWEALNAEICSAYALVADDREADARPILERAVATAAELHAPPTVVEVAVALAAVRAKTDPAASARLLAASRTIADDRGYPLDPRYVLPLAEQAEAALRQRLGDQFESEWEAGRALSFEEFAALAVGES
ncbi:MAG TPA: adenylate/guanylate cyclase domain-containing protein [Gaiellaceae bacterium]